MREIEALRNALRENSPDGFLFEKPLFPEPALSSAIWRFLKAWTDSRSFGPDHEVLLRQVGRWNEIDLFLGTCPDTLSQHAARAGLEVTDSGMLRTAPFSPSWLSDDVLPASGIDTRPTRRQLLQDVAGESYLSSLGYRSWRSLAQKEAAWLTLSTQPGHSTIIVLPTGMGKSLCFQLLAMFSGGLTVVIVPTVALAIDQWRSAKEVFANIPHINPVYFAAQDPNLDPDTTIRLIETQQSRIVFTSPEACVSGRLRSTIETFARSGLLENLVIDEAHLIDTWGSSFRIDFQILSGLRTKWLDESDHSFRTLLLSATITPNCRAILEELFPSRTGSSCRAFVYQQLRPEMVYYNGIFSTEMDRYSAVLECVWNLPRPAVIYTTEVKEAESLYARLFNEEGFRRVGCFHGDTPPQMRGKLLTRWRNDELDLMVATSAFGLGVDKADVRSVVHACYPEDLNRYYQEVGRGGRDGFTNICVLLPTKGDLRVAANLSPTLLREDSIQSRWEAMWQSREAIDEGNLVWKLCLNSKRKTLLGSRTWSQNARWNKRLIMQLRRAGLLQLRDVEYRYEEDEDSEPTEWAEVRIQFSPNSPNVGSSISVQRDEEIASSQRGLSQIGVYLDGTECLGRTLRKLYGDQTRIVCGGCRWCRQRGRPAGSSPIVELEFDRAAATPTISIVENCPTPDGQDRRKFRNMIRQCVESKGIRRFATGHDKHQELLLECGAAFSYRPERFRVDDLDGDVPFDVLPNETVVIVHVDEVNSNGARFERGAQVVHFLGPGLSYQHIRYKLPANCTNPEFHRSVEQWLA